MNRLVHELDDEFFRDIEALQLFYFSLLDLVNLHLLGLPGFLELFVLDLLYLLCLLATLVLG